MILTGIIMRVMRDSKVIVKHNIYLLEVMSELSVSLTIIIVGPDSQILHYVTLRQKDRY